MKNVFSGFYVANKEELTNAWDSQETFFVFDTNVLLNLYSYAESTREDFYDILEHLGSRVWLPYHIGLEYQRRRLDIIKRQKDVFKTVDDGLTKLEQELEKSFPVKALKVGYPKLSDKFNEFSTEVKSAIKRFDRSRSYWDKRQPCVRSNDDIRLKLDQIFEDRLGERPINQDWLDQIYQEGKDRYDLKIPPGFMDSKKKDQSDNFYSYDGLNYQRQYGDLIIWKQIIEKCNEAESKNIIFVTEDTKEDWWEILNSRGEKPIGPHPQLIAEIKRETDIDTFHMYTTADFFSASNDMLDMHIGKSSIDDASQPDRLLRPSALRSASEYSQLLSLLNYDKKALESLKYTLPNNSLKELYNLENLARDVNPNIDQAAFEAAKRALDINNSFNSDLIKAQLSFLTQFIKKDDDSNSDN